MNFILKGDGWFKDGYSIPRENEGADAGEAQVTTDQ